jgi:hypothetical protein
VVQLEVEPRIAGGECLRSVALTFLAGVVVSLEECLAKALGVKTLKRVPPVGGIG